MLNITTAVTSFLAIAAAASPASAAPAAATFGGHTSQREPIVMTLPKGRSRATISLSWHGQCGTDGPMSTWSTYALKLSKRGAFNISKSKTEKYDDGYVVTETYKAVGKVTKSASTGTVQIRMKSVAPSGQAETPCATDKIRFTLRDDTLAGRTSDGAPAVMELAPGRTRIDALMLPWTAKCNSGEWIWDTTALSGPIDAAGAFTGTIHDTVDLGDGKQAIETETLTGTLSGGKVLGVWQLTANIVDPSGLSVDTCDSGRVTFRLV
jgi:hypothetical protein